MINTQRNLLRTAVFHLIRNVLEAPLPGGTVSVSTRREGDTVTLAISDTGPGIPGEDRERVFHPFFSTKQYRFGMDLPLVRQIVTEHLGESSVESREGMGTTFSLLFPVR
ncbi:MAG: ATP-binding protein [Alphaproteobacteria bacterium]|uniref:histidine kinase n=1 Tax=Candidatus Nitrobium versatile TaxID=2884831 RepID=A0A953M0K6_9BACT|nr:ATP-binding protein [Candidatus Nitrobium versatile]